MHQSECDAIGCRASVPTSQIYCARHLAMVEPDTRRVLERTFKPGRYPSKVFTVTLERSRQEILFYQTNGHRMPREANFEWTD